ncbi:MAG: hypothetical protein ABI243_09830 [Lapillicoccus sp.]
MTTPAHPTPDYPQDAPHPAVEPVSLEKRSTTPETPALTAGPVPIQHSNPKRETTYLPAPTGPSWGTVLTGLFFMVVAAGVILNQVNGFQISDFRDVGPGVLAGVGVLFALIGGIGMVGRRHR